MRHSSSGNPTVLYPGILLFVLGLAVSSLGSSSGFSSIDPDEVVGPALFWISVGMFLIALPLRGVATSFSRAIRRPLGAGVFAIYLTAHLLLYGFVLDAIFASVYGVSALAQPYDVFVTTNVFQPYSAVALLFDLTYNPAITLTFPPVFGAALTFYSIAVAVVIAVLIVANIGKAGELGELCTRSRKARSYVLLPVLGIVLGASCCLSVAGIVALAVPAAAALTSVTWVYYVTYFLFPSVAIVLLYLNLRSIDRISASIGGSSP